MKNRFFFGLLAVLAAASVCVYAETITMTNKKTYTGEILDMDNDGVKLKDKAKGMTVFLKWDNMTLASIKEHNPDLYEVKLAERKAEIEKQKQELGLVKYTSPEGKEIFVTPERKTELENRAKGLDLYQGKWLPTNQVAELKLDAEMKKQGKVKYDGKWYNAEEVQDIETFKKNKGLRVGMKAEEVKAAWGEPTSVRKSADFSSRKREMWIYVKEEQEIEDRVVMEQDQVLQIMTNQPVEDF